MCHFLCHVLCHILPPKEGNLGMLTDNEYITEKRRYFRRKVIFTFLCLLFLYLLWKMCVLYYINSIFTKVPVYPVMAGFFVASVRSIFKMCLLLRKEKKDEKDEKEIEKKFTKPCCAWCWTYFVNYPLILGLIYILGTYFSRNHPCYISYSILFGLGFFVDDVFNRPLDFFRP